MILVDTSVWIDFLRQSESSLVQMLESNQVVVHPWVIGELACGNLNNRRQVLELLQGLPQAPLLLEEEQLVFMENNQLMGRGIGYIDLHLLASAKLANHRLWTRDRRLHQVAAMLGLALEESAH